MAQESCTHDCSSCQEECSSRKTDPKDFLEKPNSLSSIKNVIGVVSGKGGVGKSMVTSLLAVLLNRRGYHTGILDADITGPSIPRIFGVSDKIVGNDKGLVPAKSKSGIDIMSVNLLLEEESTPVVWRGPIIGNVVKQFWTDVVWKDVDFLFVDMPPGTGDVPLTVFQSIPLNGIVIVTSPQELVTMIVSKAVNMANMMQVPILGIVENMSYIRCPYCGREIKMFGESHVEQIAGEFGLKVLGKCPLDPDAASKCDAGLAEEIPAPWLKNAADIMEHLMGKA